MEAPAAAGAAAGMLNSLGFAAPLRIRPLQTLRHFPFPRAIFHPRKGFLLPGGANKKCFPVTASGSCAGGIGAERIQQGKLYALGAWECAPKVWTAEGNRNLCSP